MLNKEQRNDIINFLENLCSKTRMERKTVGYTLRSFHISAPYILFILLIFGSHFCVIIVFLNLFAVLTCFMVFGGCFLSALEHRLCGDEFTIADPFLEIFNMEKTNANRLKVTYVIITNYTIIFCLVYYLRFHYNISLSKTS